jgi:GNAT superfamily N-acetyltransferase
VDPTQIDPRDVAATEALARPLRTPGSGGRAPGDVREIELRDGSRIWVRPIRAEDRDRIVRGLSQLSPRSRYLRFHSHVDHLTAAQLDYLVDVDHVDHEALVAVDPDVEGHPGVAVARYIRLAEDPQVAEAAITVLDAYQGLGIGTAMIGLLERAAHEQGIRTFRNYVLAENEAMLEIFRQLDGEVVVESPGLYRVDVPVPDAGEAQPDTPAGRWVAQVAREPDIRAESWAYPLVWLLRRVLGGDADDGPPEGGEPSVSRLLKRFADGSADPDPGEGEGPGRA